MGVQIGGSFKSMDADDEIMARWLFRGGEFYLFWAQCERASAICTSCISSIRPFRLRLMREAGWVEMAAL